MGFVLISATPSPFARMNRIAMLEKGIPFELQNEIPWHKSETETPKYNPLEKFPILLHSEDANFEPKIPDKGPRLLTGDVDLDLKARQIQVLSEGVLDAFVLKIFETARDKDKQSKECIGRQERKVQGGLRAMNDLAKRPREAEYLVGNGRTYTIADIAVACAVGQLEFFGANEGWKTQHPELAQWFEKMDAREHYVSTRPVMFDIKVNTII